jgi:hypothetical protein
MILPVPNISASALSLVQSDWRCLNDEGCPMFRREILLSVCVTLIALPGVAFAQAADLAKFVPGKWMSPTGKVGVELDSIVNGVVTGKWLDVDGKIYPIGAKWVQGTNASGRFENGVFHMTTPPGNKWELILSSDGKTLTGTRQVVNNFQPGNTQFVLTRK